MITYDEALEIARMRKENADTCIEYKSQYVFTAKEDANYVGGYGYCAIVISKEDGSFIRFTDFMIEDEKEIREIYLGNNSEELE